MRRSHMTFFFVLSFIFALSVSGCQPQHNTNPPTYELIKSHEIKKVSSAKILLKASELGDTIAMSIRERITAVHKQLDSAVCESSKLQILEPVEFSYGVRIRRLNNLFKPSKTIEEELLIAYQYNFDNGHAMRSSVQKNNDKYVLYISPIQTGDTFYSICADDSVKQFIGLWAIEIPVKKLVDVL